jgi:hypothetical protein
MAFVRPGPCVDPYVDLEVVGESKACFAEFADVLLYLGMN